MVLIYFRRASNNNARVSWKCKRGKEDCIIASKSKKKSFCKKCRYSKCIETGLKASLVDKTKKAIVEFYAKQSRSTNPQNSQIEEIQSEKSTNTNENYFQNSTCIPPDERLLQHNDSQQQSFLTETITQNKNSDLAVQVSLAQHQAFASQQRISCNLRREKLLMISNEYTPDDINYFSLVSNAVKLYEDAILKLIISDPQCKIEMLDYSQQLQAIGETGSNRLRYSPVLEGRIERLSKENVGVIFKALNPDITGSDLNDISKLLSKHLRVFCIFLSHTYSDMTHRQFFGNRYTKHIDSVDFQNWHWQYLEKQVPDIIQSNLFASPWAPSLELEEFFYQTAESVKELLQDPVRFMIAIPILIASCSTDIGKYCSNKFL